MSRFFLKLRRVSFWLDGCQSKSRSLPPGLENCTNSICQNCTNNAGRRTVRVVAGIHFTYCCVLLPGTLTLTPTAAGNWFGRQKQHPKESVHWLSVCCAALLADGGKSKSAPRCQ